MTDRPREIWCDTGLYWDYVEDWSEGSWRDNDDSGGEKYVRADRIEELEAKLAKAMLSVKRLSTSECFGPSEVWGLSLSDSPLGREILARMDYANTTLAAVSETHKLKGETDE